MSAAEQQEHRDQHIFQPRAYLDEYFLDIDQEYHELYRFWASELAQAPQGPALELGVGPTLYSAIGLAKRHNPIHLADYVIESFIESEKWLNNSPEQFNWRPHIGLALQAEGQQGTHEQIQAREAAMRKNITALFHCNILDPDPLSNTASGYDSYAVVTAHYCTEAATGSQQEWQAVITHICGLLKPKGTLLLSVSTDLQRFRAYGDQDQADAAPDISQKAIHTALDRAGIALTERRLKYLAVPKGLERPYSGTWLVSARKKDSGRDNN